MDKAAIFSVFIIVLLNSCDYKKSEKTITRKLKNGLWCESIYFRGYRPSTGEPLTNSATVKFANTLKSNNIKYAFIFAGPYGADGHLPDYPFSATAKSSISIIKRIYPEVVILPWIGGIQDKTVFLNNPEWVDNAIADTKRLVDTLACEGIHVDLEYILDEEEYLASELKRSAINGEKRYGDDVNGFHARLRKALPRSFISSVVTATSSVTRPWKRKTSIHELNTLVRFVDQINFLYYDTNIHDQDTFQKGADQMLSDIRRLKLNAEDTEYLISVGTFINEPLLQRYRNTRIESIANTIETIRTSIKRIKGNTGLFDGVSIFCEWETDDIEWREFRRETSTIE